MDKILQAVQAINAKIDAKIDELNSKMEARDLKMEKKIKDLKKDIDSRSKKGSSEKLSDVTASPAPVPVEVGPILQIESMINLGTKDPQLHEEKYVLKPRAESSERFVSVAPTSLSLDFGTAEPIHLGRTAK